MFFINTLTFFFVISPTLLFINVLYFQTQIFLRYISNFAFYQCPLFPHIRRGARGWGRPLLPRVQRQEGEGVTGRVSLIKACEAGTERRKWGRETATCFPVPGCGREGLGSLVRCVDPVVRSRVRWFAFVIMSPLVFCSCCRVLLGVLPGVCLVGPRKGSVLCQCVAVTEESMLCWPLL